MWNSISGAAFRTVLAFLLVMFLARVMGRKLISQMTFFNFIIGVTLGSVTANFCLGASPNVSSAATTLVTMTGLSILSGYLHIKNFLVRKLVNSEPVTMIANGKIVEENLKRTRVNLNELLMLLREKNIFNISDVEFALLETDGKISVQPKSQKQPLTPSDLNLPTSYKGLTKDLIIDGEIMKENLNDAKISAEWIIGELQNREIHSVKEVFYAGLDTQGNLYISLKNKSYENHGQYGIE